MPQHSTKAHNRIALDSERNDQNRRDLNHAAASQIVRCAVKTITSAQNTVARRTIWHPTYKSNPIPSKHTALQPRYRYLHLFRHTQGLVRHTPAPAQEPTLFTDNTTPSSKSPKPKAKALTHLLHYQLPLHFRMRSSHQTDMPRDHDTNAHNHGEPRSHPCARYASKCTPQKIRDM